jgi:hypothetical protein
MRSGDIIYADRGNYRHFGIYVGNGCAVHYTHKGSVTGLRTQIKETPLGVFARGNDVCVWRISRTDGLSCYSREETVRRARSMVGVKNYNLLFNNCEHFAFWCKTGVSRSGQVESIFADVVLTAADPILKILDAAADVFYDLVAIF